MKVLYQMGLYLCLAGAAISAHGQESASCTQQSFDEAEASYRLRAWRSETKIKAERQLKALVQNCAGTPEHYQAEEHLTAVQEELAESNLQLAKFYLSKAQGGKAGGRSRLKEIIARYTKFTKLDEVLSLLGRSNIDPGYLEDAATCYRRLINDFPNSQYAGEATIQLSVIEVMRVTQNP